MGADHEVLDDSRARLTIEIADLAVVERSYALGEAADALGYLGECRAQSSA